MMSTPFGPVPPATAPAPADQPPVVPPADGPDTSIRSIASTPTVPPTEAGAAGLETSVAVPAPVLPAAASEQTGTLEPDTWPWLREQAESESLLPGMLMGLGVMIAIYVMMRHLRRKQAHRPVVPPAEDRIAAIHERAISGITPVERAMSEAEELARRLAATMENKAARLELLIEEADRKLEELNRAVAHAGRVGTAAADRTARAARTIDPSLLDRARVEQDRADRHARNGSHEPERLNASTSPVPTTLPLTHSPGAEVKRQTPNFPADPVHRRVWALADDGMPATDIARSLNQPVGQVELILNLRKSG